MSLMRYRKIIRGLHIVAASFLGAYFYSPFLAKMDWSLPFIQYVLFPLLALSGVAMWQQVRILRLLNS